METKKVFLTEDEIPRQWYNILADIKMNPPLGPDGKPISPDMLAPVFPMNLIEQEVSSERWIDIPEEVLRVLRIWRPSPLVRAYELEKALDTPARIYYKYEGVSPPGSHKPNTAVAQAYYNKEFGIKRLTTETGAGQWGSALAFACSQFGLECKVYMVRISFDQKPYRKTMMATWGANCIASPSTETKAGRQILEQDPVRHATPLAVFSIMSCCIRRLSVWKPKNRWKKSASIRMSSSGVPAAAATLPVWLFRMRTTNSTARTSPSIRLNRRPVRP